jgi:YD repeat-containing protein
MLTIPRRFSGPPGSANGGYVAGRVAASLPDAGPRQVTLRRPPPLDTPMDVSVDGGRVCVTLGGDLVAEAEPGGFTSEPVEPVTFDTAAAQMGRYAGLENHPFPGCFSCGTDRAAPDGLGLRPGRLEDRADTVATAWVPDGSIAGAEGLVGAEMVWAALDCPGGWSADLIGRPMVLGRITADVHALPEVDDRCVVVGRLLGTEGRRTFTTSTAYDGDGRILGHAEAIWFEIDVARLTQP